MESFIDEVRVRPVLWDTRQELYRDANVKDSAWQELSEIFEKEKSALKADWKKLRDAFRHAVSRKKTKSGQAAKKAKEWKYEKQMSFLLPTMVHRPSETNVPPPPPQPAAEELIDMEEDVSEDDIAEEQDGDRNETAEPGDSAATKERRNRSPRGVDKVINFMKEKEKNKAPKTLNDVDLFFASASQSVQRLPRYLQTRVKRELLDSIARAEEEEDFARNPSSARFVNHPTHQPQLPSPSTSSSTTSSSRPPSTNPYHTFHSLFNPNYDSLTLSEVGVTYQNLQ